MNQKQYSKDSGTSELRPFVPGVSAVFGGAFLLWLTTYFICLRVFSYTEGPAGLIALGISLTAATVVIGAWSTRSNNLRQWQARDARAGSRLVLALILSWAGAFLAYYFLAISQGVGHVLSAVLIFLALLAGNLMIIVLDWELTIYLFFGVLTTLVSYGSFALADRIMNGPNLGVPRVNGLAGGFSWFIPQAISFMAAMLFAYPMNRKYVFESRGPVLKEFAGFVSSRLLMTLIFEFGVFWLIHNLMGLNRDLTKILTSLLVTIANYVVSKLLIFTDKGDDTKDLPQPDKDIRI